MISLTVVDCAFRLLSSSCKLDDEQLRFKYRVLSVSSSIIVLANIVVLFIYVIVNIADYLLV